MSLHLLNGNHEQVLLRIRPLDESAPVYLSVMILLACCKASSSFYLYFIVIPPASVVQ